METNKKMSYITNLIYFIVVVCFVIIRICSSLNLFAFLGTFASQIVGIFTQIGLLFIFPIIMFKALNKTTFKETFKGFNFKKVSVKTVFASIALGAVVFFLNVYVSGFFNSIIQFFGYKHTPSAPSGLEGEWWMLILNLLTVAVLPAICEETLHRGMLLKGNSPYGMKKTVIISSVLFGLLHLNIEQVFYAMLIGLFLGFLCYGCSSIYPCIIVHFMNNALSVFLSFARVKGWAIGNIFAVISEFLLKNPLLGIILFLLFLGLLILILIDLTKFLFKDSFQYNFVIKQKELTSMFIRETYFSDIEQIKAGKGDNLSESEAKNQVVYVDFKEFMSFVNKNMSDVFKHLDKDLKKFDINKMELKYDKKAKIFLIGSIVLSAIVTLMTFFWGLL